MELYQNVLLHRKHKRENKRRQKERRKKKKEKLSTGYPHEPNNENRTTRQGFRVNPLYTRLYIYQRLPPTLHGKKKLFIQYPFSTVDQCYVVGQANHFLKVNKAFWF